MIISTVLRKGIHMNMFLILSVYLARIFFLSWHTQIELQCTLQIVCEDSALFVWADLHVSLCRRAAASEMRASNSPGVSTSVLWTSLVIQCDEQKSNGVSSVDSNSSVSLNSHNYTHVQMNLFSKHDRYYHFPKHWPLFLHHNICISNITCGNAM